MLIYNPENKDIFISKLEDLTEYNLDEGIEKIDRYNLYVVTAKKYDDNQFLITRVSSLGNWNTENNGINHTGNHDFFANRLLSNLSISIPKDGFVLLFQRDTNLLLPSKGEILQFNGNFNYKNITNGAYKNGYGTITKVPNNGEEFEEEKNVLDIYSIKKIYKFGTDGAEKHAIYPVLVYNDSDGSQAMNSKYILDKIGSYEASQQQWKIIIFVEKYDDKRYKVISTLETYGTSLNNITNTIPKDGFALIFSDYCTYVPETKLPVKGDTLYVDFDYTYLSGIKDEGEFGFIYTYRNIEIEELPVGNGLKPLKNEDKYLINKNEVIVNDTNDIKVNLYDYNYNVNSKYWSKYDVNKKSYYPFFSTASPLKKIYSGNVSGMLELNQYLNEDYDNGVDNRNNTNETLNDVVRKSISNNHINKDSGKWAITGVMKKTLDGNGYPVVADLSSNDVNNSPGYSLDYLFGGEQESINNGTVKAYENLNGLLIYSKENKEYKIDSTEVTAQYNAETNKFDLYKERITPNFLTYQYGNFMPFNDIRYATQVTTINKSYFDKVAKSAELKESNLENNSHYTGWYSHAAEIIAMCRDYLTNLKGNNWTYKEVLGVYDEKECGWEMSTNGWAEYYNGIDEKNKNKYYLHYDNMYNIDYDDMKDYHFGMSVEFDFRALGTEKKDEDDIYYKFAGDDDVLVYIDDVLFMELAGIHRQIGGEINFSTGEVKYYQTGNRLGSVTDYQENMQPAPNKTFSEIINSSGKNITLDDGTFPKNTIHTLKFYYLERGSGSSLCNMKFNVNVMPSGIKVSGEKKWTSYENENIVPEDKPDNIKVNLYRRLEHDVEGTEELINTQEISAENGWKYEFTKDNEGNDLIYGVEKEINGERIIDVYVYTVKEEYVNEEDVQKYSEKYLTEYERDELNSTDTLQVINIENKYIGTDIQVEKKWKDTDEKPGIEVELLAKIGNNDVTTEIFTNEKIEELTQTLNEQNNWSYTWSLPKYKVNNDGILEEIIYEMKENLTDEQKEKYYQLGEIEKDCTENGIQKFTITNVRYKDILITKVDKDNPSFKLSNAKFELQKMKQDEKGKWVEDKSFEALVGITSNDRQNLGELKFEKLEIGTYRLTEVKAPSGYKINKKEKYIEIVEGDSTVGIEVENSKAFGLPLTGGSGSRLFIIVGGILIITSFEFIRPILIINGKYKKKPRRRKRSR